MSEELLRVIEQIGRERGIGVEVLFKAVEAGVQSACEAHLRTGERVKAELDRETGELHLYSVREVVDRVEDERVEIAIEEARKRKPDAKLGDQILDELKLRELGRIAAKAARQVISARMREAERESLYRYYAERIGQVVSGVVQRFEKGLVIVDLGRTDAIIPRNQQSPRDRYRPGDRIKAYLQDVRRTHVGTQIVLSRSHPGLIVRLFEMEVPEVYERVVEIKGAVREPGERAKVCVVSNDPNVDPVGACVGIKGARVQAVVRELNGENVDIVEWSEDPATFIGRALSPAAVSRIILRPELHQARVVVADHNLSLAIGKRGQNVRLASKLTGWRLDIRSESESEQQQVEIKQRVAMLRAEIATIPGIGAAMADKVIQAGFDSVGKLADCSPSKLMRVPDLTMTQAEAIIQRARELQAARRAQRRPPGSAFNSGVANDG
jgi:N utilization substance protein A